MARINDGITVRHEVSINGMVRIFCAILIANILTFTVAFFCVRAYIHYSVGSFAKTITEMREKK